MLARQILRSFSTPCSLNFFCGDYLRSGKSIAVTDSAYGFIDAMVFLALWGISWVTSLRLKQRRGFLGVNEFPEALKTIYMEKITSGKMKVLPDKREFSKEVAAWEKED